MKTFRLLLLLATLAAIVLGGLSCVQQFSAQLSARKAAEYSQGLR